MEHRQLGAQQLIHELWSIEREPDIGRIIKLTGRFDRA